MIGIILRGEWHNKPDRKVHEKHEASTPNVYVARAGMLSSRRGEATCVHSVLEAIHCWFPIIVQFWKHVEIPQ